MAAACRRLDALPLAAVVAPIAAMEAGELLALTRHVRPRLLPGAAPPAATVAEPLGQMSAEALRELGQRRRGGRPRRPEKARPGVSPRAPLKKLSG